MNPIFPLKHFWDPVLSNDTDKMATASPAARNCVLADPLAFAPASQTLSRWIYQRGSWMLLFRCFYILVAPAIKGKHYMFSSEQQELRRRIILPLS